MSNLKLLRKILRLKSLKIICFWFQHRETELHLAVKPYKNGCRCPACGRRGRIVHHTAELRRWEDIGVYPGFPTIFRGLSEFFVGDLMGKALWKLVENAQRFPRRGGRVLCVHGPVSFHRARPCATKWPPRRGLRTGPPASSDCGRP